MARGLPQIKRINADFLFCHAAYMNGTQMNIDLD